MGFLTNLLNPKAAVLYLSLLPQFIQPERGHVLMQSLILGLTQMMTISVTVNAAITIAAGSIATFFVLRYTWLKVQRWVMGTNVPSVGHGFD